MTLKLIKQQALFFDAEYLAEGGIGKAYKDLLPELKKFVPVPEKVIENREGGGYSVTCGKVSCIISTANDNEYEWEKATVALFSIVNEQLKATNHRFFALQGGNDLMGVFLSLEDAEAAKTAIRKKDDRPYLAEEELRQFLS